MKQVFYRSSKFKFSLPPNHCRQTFGEFFKNSLCGFYTFVVVISVTLLKKKVKILLSPPFNFLPNGKKEQYNLNEVCVTGLTV